MIQMARGAKPPLADNDLFAKSKRRENMQSQKQFRAQIRKYLKRGFNVIVAYSDYDKLMFPGNCEYKHGNLTFSYHWRNRPNNVASMKIVSFNTQRSFAMLEKLAKEKTWKEQSKQAKTENHTQ
jgi:hypothetical protein